MPYLSSSSVRCWFPAIIGCVPRATLIPRNGQPPSPQDPKDLPFLDPNRKQETQTREELIY
ncbi:hypothetical protein ANCDUO_19105 [Ancylostoma duodenale]|uniref:Uncharacterized protein n=1 Tax=Ancylostoma duodenale TaxID=51022 RepID=A0A0C2C3F0_9BILA|nr:hypothetical protein ANCDUO_19105 [Ancylostoma duodenale]